MFNHRVFRYNSTKFYRELGPVAYRQWRADSHCNQLHGYALSFLFHFSSDDVDVRNWVVDFGALKPLKEKLQEWFDHTLLVAMDDPEIEHFLALHKAKLARVVEVERTGCEGIADFLYRYINNPEDGFMKSLGYSNVWCTRIEVRETEANMAYVEGTPETWSLFEEE